MLVRCMLADILAPMPQTPRVEHDAVRQWVRDEMDLMKKIRVLGSHRCNNGRPGRLCDQLVGNDGSGRGKEVVVEEEV